MSTKSTTQSTNQYNMPSLNDYNSLQQAVGPQLQGNIANPFGNQSFLNSLRMGIQGITGIGASNTQGIAQRGAALGTPGMGPGGALGSSLALQAGRNTAANMGGMRNNLILNAANLQQQSASAGLNYRPLQTGGTQTQTTSGLGTWLPQLAGAGIQAGMSAYNNFRSNPNNMPASAFTSSANSTPLPSQSANLSGAGMSDPWGGDPTGWSNNASYGVPFPGSPLLGNPNGGLPGLPGYPGVMY